MNESDIYFIIKKWKHNYYSKKVYKMIILGKKGFVTKKIKKNYVKDIKNQMGQKYMKVQKGLYVNIDKLKVDNEDTMLVKEARKNGEKVLNLLHDLPKKLCDSVISKLEESPSHKKKKVKLILMPQPQKKSCDTCGGNNVSNHVDEDSFSTNYGCKSYEHLQPMVRVE